MRIITGKRPVIERKGFTYAYPAYFPREHVEAEWRERCARNGVPREAVISDVPLPALEVQERRAEWYEVTL